MNEIIFKYPGQKFVGIANRLADGTLKHTCFILVEVLPKEGDTLLGRDVSEVLTNDAMLKEQSLFARNEIEAIAVLGKQV